MWVTSCPSLSGIKVSWVQSCHWPWTSKALAAICIFIARYLMFFPLKSQILLPHMSFHKYIGKCYATPPSAGIACLVGLHFTVLLACGVLHRLKDCGTPSLSKSTGAILPTAFAHFVSLGHMLVMLTIFQPFSLLLCLLWWSVIFDVTVVIVLVFFSNKVILNKKNLL